MPDCQVVNFLLDRPPFPAEVFLIPFFAFVHVDRHCEYRALVVDNFGSWPGRILADKKGTKFKDRNAAISFPVVFVDVDKGFVLDGFSDG